MAHSLVERKLKVDCLKGGLNEKGMTKKGTPRSAYNLRLRKNLIKEKLWRTRQRKNRQRRSRLSWRNRSPIRKKAKGKLRNLEKKERFA